ncbi:MAG: hypothetical protein JWO92_2539 [Chitinophagaceae bacterium]|nr:hypothetical protein [Chitinophagaceae bacterium]
MKHTGKIQWVYKATESSVEKNHVFIYKGVFQFLYYMYLGFISNANKIYIFKDEIKKVDERKAGS